MPGFFPMTFGDGPYTLWYGIKDGVKGVYIARDSSSWPEMCEYVAASLTRVLFYGEGFDVIARY